MQLRQPYLCVNEEKPEYSTVNRHYMPDEEKIEKTPLSKRSSVATLQRFTTSILGDEVSYPRASATKYSYDKSFVIF